MNDKRTAVEAAVQSCYSTWGQTYYQDYYGAGAPYPPVHVDLLRAIVLGSGARTLLDAGCGPASFLRHMTRDGLDLYGFDLTSEMVDEAKRVLNAESIDPHHVWQGSVLAPTDFFPPGMPSAYDAAVCIGVLPHIPDEHDETVFANMRAVVRPGGLVAVEARNRLFSLFTQNRPSYDFIRNDLIRADDLMARSGAAAAGIEAALESLKGHFRMDLPPVRRGKAGEPGYDEVLSRTHNPFILRAQFERAGFRNVRVLFYHYHALPPMLAEAAGPAFRAASIGMEDPADWRGYFMASAFVLAGVRD